MQRQQAIAVVSRPGDQGRAERARAARRVDKHRAPALRSHHDRHLRAAADHRELPGGGAGGVAARDRRPPPHQVAGERAGLRVLPRGRGVQLPAVCEPRVPRQRRHARLARRLLADPLQQRAGAAGVLRQAGDPRRDGPAARGQRDDLHAALPGAHRGGPAQDRQPHALHARLQAAQQQQVVGHSGPALAARQNGLAGAPQTQVPPARRDRRPARA
mmetsp:Transcript_38376/g.90592  ORF Transcript_38376/g.90592 Transcript_38376/m.90592 type:complete len:216 (+) Transcript_38376:1813-2460(+)